MIPLLLVLITTSQAVETDQELHQRLLGTPYEDTVSAEQVDPIDESIQSYDLSGTGVSGTNQALSHQSLASTNPLQSRKAPVASAAPSLLSTIQGFWPFMVAVVMAGAFYMFKKKGIKLPGIEAIAKNSSTPLKVVSRSTLGGAASLVLIDVEGADGSIRRLLLGTGGNNSPTLVTDLGDQHGQQNSEWDAGPTMLAPEPMAKEIPIPDKRVVSHEIGGEVALPVMAELDEDELVEGVEPGSDPLHLRLQRLRRHRRKAERPVHPKATESLSGGANGQAGNADWRSSTYADATASASSAQAEPGSGVVFQRSNASKSHIEKLAAKQERQRTAADPIAQKETDSKLNVNNAFEAELRRRVYDASPGERRARSEAAKNLVQQMLAERRAQQAGTRTA